MWYKAVYLEHNDGKLPSLYAHESKLRDLGCIGLEVVKMLEAMTAAADSFCDNKYGYPIEQRGIWESLKRAIKQLEHIFEYMKVVEIVHWDSQEDRYYVAQWRHAKEDKEGENFEWHIEKEMGVWL